MLFPQVPLSTLSLKELGVENKRWLKEKVKLDMEAMVGHLKLGQKFHLRRREPYSEEEERKIVEWILVRERLQSRNWSVGGKTVLQLCPYCFSTILWRLYNLPIFRKRDLEDHGKPGCPARQVLAKHQGAVSKSHPQVKLYQLSFPFPSIFHLIIWVFPFHLFSVSRKIVRGGYSYRMSEEQEKLLHMLRDFTTIRDNAAALRMQ